MHPHTSPSTSRSPKCTITIRNRRGRQGPLGTITVMLLTLMGLAAMSGAGGIRPRDASAHAGGGVITLANYGAATVDGVFTDGEYGEGCFLPGSQNVGGTTYHLTVCATNDDVNDYYAFLIDDLTLATAGDPAGLDGINLLFDNQHDGSLACPKAEDAIGAASQPAGSLIDMAYCGAFDFFSGDTQTNGNAAMTFSPNVGYVYEMMHPLNSGDPADYALALHDTVGFCAVYLDSANDAGEVQFPKNCFGDGEKYGDVFKKGEFDAKLAELSALVDSCEPCPPGTRRPLKEDIDLAIRQYTQNDEAATAQTLDAFVTKVERGLQSGSLPESVGRQLIALSNPVIEELSGAEAGSRAKAGSKAEVEAKSEARTTKSRDSSHKGKEKKAHHNRKTHHHRRNR